VTRVAVIGGGITGCATAALLAEAGAAVTLFEREAIGAGASGRNSGLLQAPSDPLLAPLYEASIALYQDLGHGFALPETPADLLMISSDPEALRAGFTSAPAAEWLDDAGAAEPALGPGLSGYRMQGTLPVGPTAATRAWAARARGAGAELVIGRAAAPAVREGRVEGVRAGDALHPADAVVLAAGPWTPGVPVRPVWGVVAQVRLGAPPRHQIEEAGIEALTEPGAAPPKLFSLVTTGAVSAVGSTFTQDEPDPQAVAAGLLERGARYVPALAGAAIEHVRACARPVSDDGLPILGPTDVEGLHVITGHGPWGITLGPGSAKLVAEAVLGGADAVPAPLRYSSSRFLRSSATTVRSAPLP
jgi:glycine oxidase